MAESFTLSHARLISLSEAGTIPRGYIRISDGYIEDIGSMDAYVAKGGEYEFNLDGKTILPGLIDSHCHLISENAYPITESYIARSVIAGVHAARWALEDGITSVRDVGCRHLGIYALREAVISGQVSGPRFQTAGRPISGTGIMETWRSYSHDGIDEILRGVRKEWQAGANWIKLSISDGRWRDTSGWQDTPLLNMEEINSAVEETHRKDMRVVCHVDGPVGARLAIQAGVDSVEHGVYIPDELLQPMAENGIFLVPTVWIYSTRDLYVFKADINYLNELHADTINRARSAGVKIAAGVDCSYSDCPPLEGMVNELKVLVACGLSNMEAIESATIRGAELMGWEEYLGSLTPGKLADMVVVDGNPIDDIQNLNRIVLVIQHGQIVANKLEGKAIIDRLPKPSLLPSWMN